MGKQVRPPPLSHACNSLCHPMLRALYWAAANMDNFKLINDG